MRVSLRLWGSSERCGTAGVRGICRGNTIRALRGKWHSEGGSESRNNLNGNTYIYGAKFYTPPPPPMKLPFQVGGEEGGGEEKSCRGGLQNLPPPLPEKCLLAQNGGRGGDNLPLEYSKNVSSGRVATKLLRTFFWWLSRKGAAIHPGLREDL